MKSKLHAALLLTGCMALAAIAQPLSKPDTSASGPPDKETLSYVRGMQLGLEVKRAGIPVDTGAVFQGLRDVLDGRPTQVQETEIPMLYRQAEVFQKAKELEKEQGQPSGAAQPRAVPPDKTKFGYAIGMRNGGHIKRVGAELNSDTVIRAAKDVIEGKPTKLQEADLDPILQKYHEQTIAKEAGQNQAAGAAFLVNNAKEPGVKVLPDGLQYKVLKTGSGPVPTTNDLIFIKCRGHLLSGREFFHHDHFLTRTTGGCKGWQVALQRMRVGDRWQIFVPPDLAFGPLGDPFQKVGPQATVIYDLELLAIPQPGDPGIGTGRMGRGLDGETPPPGS